MSRKPISHSFYRGKQVGSHEELSQLAREGRSVYYEHWGIKPAIFVINLPYCFLVEIIGEGELYRTVK